jgi:hypothetical protein
LAPREWKDFWLEHGGPDCSSKLDQFGCGLVGFHLQAVASLIWLGDEESLAHATLALYCPRPVKILVMAKLLQLSISRLLGTVIIPLSLTATSSAVAASGEQTV